MPFTPSHAAIVLPFIRSGYFSATALIIGSMAPDFEYFFTMNDQGIHGHTLAGFFYFDIPVTILAAFVFHYFVKFNLIDNLPYFLQRKFDDLKQLEFLPYFRKHWFLFSCSALLGTVSHIFWDSFTHPDTWAVKTFSIYETIIPFQGARYPFYYFLQTVSSYVGLFILLVFLLIKKSDAHTVLIKPSLWYWIGLCSITGLSLFFRFYWSSDPFNLVLGLISSISGLSIALIIMGWIPFEKTTVTSTPH